jgi:hypothetical protein
MSIEEYMVIVWQKVKVVPWRVDSPSQEPSRIFAFDIGFSWLLMLQMKQ